MKTIKELISDEILSNQIELRKNSKNCWERYELW